MKLTDIFALLGGLALFLYGMTMMSDGLELAAGNKMKAILEKLTSNRFLGVGVGALITAIIQSSSATTVMVVGFVNAGLMKLENAVWIIMGANIGTTITGQLIAIDITAYAPLISFIGVVLFAFIKNKKLNSFGIIIAGLGILFMGMSMMSDAMMPLIDSQEFVNLITKFENPFIGVAVGAIFTAIIQSSSASVGILQALAMSGVVTLPTAIYVLYGQNIGTCITAVLAAIGTSRNAKRTTIIHLSFNIIGTIIFVTISMLTPFAVFMQSLTPGNIPAQIANVHTTFNIVTTAVLLPFGKQLVKLSFLVLPEKKDQEGYVSTQFLDFGIFDHEYHIGTDAIASTQLFNETQSMLSVVRENIQRSFALMDNYDEDEFKKLTETEDYINYLNHEIVKFTTSLIAEELSMESSQRVGLFLKLSGDIERIGDYAVNVAQKAQFLHSEDRKFSDEAMEEIHIMGGLLNQILEELNILSHDELHEVVEKVDVIENHIRDINEDFSNNQLKRLKDKTCSPENSAVYTKVMTDFERVCDLSLKIAKIFNKIKGELEIMRMAENQ